MKKQIIKRLTAFLLAVVCTATFYTMAYAAAIVYNNIELEFITKTPSKTLNGRRYSGVGGIAAGTNRTSMFVTKAETNEDNLATEQLALFYDFPNINDTSTYYYYYIPQAGHANGMAIDNYNIYICGWRNVTKTGNQTGNDANNWIIKLPRSYFSYFRSECNGDVLDPDSPTKQGYSVLEPIIDGTVDTPFTYEIRNITKYNSNKTFIVQYFWNKNIGNNLAYTTARLVTEDGEEKFYVSTDPEDIFIVENNVLFYDGTLQDICYSPGNGLFIPIWYYDKYNKTNPLTNKNKNVIMWVDLSTTNNPKLSTITIDGVTYRYYTQPDKINVNQSGKGYDTFEVESIAITDNDEMLFSANVVQADGQQGELTSSDSVFKLTHDNRQNFVLQ